MARAQLLVIALYLCMTIGLWVETYSVMQKCVMVSCHSTARASVQSVTLPLLCEPVPHVTGTEAWGRMRNMLNRSKLPVKTLKQWLALLLEMDTALNLKRSICQVGVSSDVVSCT